MYRCTSLFVERVVFRLATQRARFCSNEQKIDAFTSGQYCLLFDAKGRRSMIKLDANQSYNHRLGVIDHGTIIGMQPGCAVHSHLRNKFRVFRPSLEEYVVLMKRKAAPAYPKDVTAMLAMMDVGPGSRIIEAGSGSGAMTLFLSRAGACTAPPTHPLLIATNSHVTCIADLPAYHDMCDVVSCH